MYEKLIDEWAKAEGFQGFQVDHAAVLRNLAKWLDYRASIEQQVRPDKSQKQCTYPANYMLCKGYRNGLCSSRIGTCRST